MIASMLLALAVVVTEQNCANGSCDARGLGGQVYTYPVFRSTTPAPTFLYTPPQTVTVTQSCTTVTASDPVVFVGVPVRAKYGKRAVRAATAPVRAAQTATRVAVNVVVLPFRAVGRALSGGCGCN